MEYTQWVMMVSIGYLINSVLILVVMEYTQWDISIYDAFTFTRRVLILVVMEYTQWDKKKYEWVENKNWS